MNKLAKTKLLIIDDHGLAPMTDPERRDLLEVIEERHGFSSIIWPVRFHLKCGMTI